MKLTKQQRAYLKSLKKTFKIQNELLQTISVQKEEIDYGTFFKPYCHITLTNEELENLTNPSKNGK